jgi:hypothetical protein
VLSAARAPDHAAPARTVPGAWAYLVVLALGCLAYLPYAGIYFLKDDLALSRITDDAGRPDAGALFRNFLWPAPETYPQVYRPVPLLFGWFDFNVFGADPAGFRICNVGFHGLNAALLAILFNQLTRFRRPAAGLFCGLLFALHPLHGEAVLWITQRMVVLCASFSLLSLVALVSWLDRRRPGALAVCAVAAAAAALSKEVTVTLPGVMVLVALLHGGRGFRERLRAALRVALLGIVVALVVLVPRKLFFGDWVAKYTHLTPLEYAAEFHVFERLPTSLVDAFWSVNAAEVPRAPRVAFGLAWLAFLAVALARLLPALRARPTRVAAVAFLALAVASFLPTLPVFFVEPTLLNGRFLYQPLLGVLGLLMAGFASPPGSRPLAGLVPPAALALLFTVALQLNLRAYHGADAQIRAIRGGIQHEAARFAPEAVIVVYHAPTGHHGVVTLDLSLALAMRPPFVAPPGLDVVPLVVGRERTWASRIPELRARLDARGGGRSILHLVAGELPSRISPLIGALAPASGASPPSVVAPADGAIAVHPDEQPSFVFDPTPGAAVYRLRFRFPADSGLADLLLDLDPARHLRRSGTRLVYRFDQGRQGGAPLEWAAHRFTNPLPIAWSLEAADALGAPLGRSAERALVLVTRQTP